MRLETKRFTAASGSLVLLLSLPGCANLTPTQQRVATGTMGGAAAGAIIGAIAGNAGMGAAIGAGAGLLGGVAVDQVEKAKERSYQEGVAAGKAQSAR